MRNVRTVETQEQVTIHHDRADLWVRAWIAVAQASNSTKPDITTLWADKFLEAYDERFAKYSSTNHENDR